MKQITLHFPILVSKPDISGKPHYNIRPLFLHYPQYTHRRYEDALRHFEIAVRKKFKGFALDRDNMEELSWFLFQPEVQLYLQPLTITASRSSPEVLFHLLVFNLQGMQVGCLPAFGHYMFLLEEDWKTEASLKLQLEKIVNRFAKDYIQETGEEIQWDELMAGKKDSLAWCDINISVSPGNFEFEELQEDTIYARIFETNDFKGEDELYQVGYALDELYPAGLQPAFFQDDFVKKLYSMLYEKENFSFVIVGDEGAGKHTVLQEAVRRYRDTLMDKSDQRGIKIWVIDPGRVIAGMSIVGQWQQRLEAIIEYVRQPVPFSGENSDILVFDNPVALTKIGKSAQNSLNMSDVLKTYIEKRQLKTVLIATPEEWKILQEKDRRFADLFQVIRLGNTDLVTAYKIALLQRQYLESGSDATISVAAIQYLFFLQRLFYHHVALPGGVIKLMNQLLTKYKSGPIDIGEVKDSFRSLSGMKDKMLEEEVLLEDGELQKEISKQLIGQPAAVEALADAIHLIKARLNNPTRPFASFLLIGPTGVGKTQAAKVLAQMLMGSEEHLIRFDMNEYIDYYAVDRLIGTYQQPEGQLTGRVRYHPFGVLLFDEIEKAHPKVLDLLLQVLDDARLTDSLGKTVSFSNLVIIMTSNVGADKVSRSLGFKTSGTSLDAIYKKAVEQQFRPEFINRIDRIVVFQPLQVQHILEIARLEIKGMLNRDGFVRRSTIFNILPEALDWVAKRGFDPLMGGRALKRQIENDLTAMSAKQLLKVPVGEPIILSIMLKDDHLYPRITPMKVVSLREIHLADTVFNDKVLKSSLYRLLEEGDVLQAKMEAYQQVQPQGSIADPANWSYFDLKDKVIAFREDIRELILRVGDAGGIFAPGETLRLKKSDMADLTRMDEQEKSLFAHSIQHWRDEFHYQNTLMSPEQSGTLLLKIRLLFLKLYLSGMMTGKTDQIEISIKSCVQGKGTEQVAHLMQIYSDLLDDMEIHHSIDSAQQIIRATGFGLYPVLSGEEGLNLFYTTGNTPVPVEVKISQATKEPIEKEITTILRIYDFPQTVIDLRSGLMGRYDLTPDELKVFLFVALDT